MRWNETDELTNEVRARLMAEFDLTTRFYMEATFGRDLYQFKFIDSGTVWAGPKPVQHDDGVNFAVTACAPQIDNFDTLSAFVMFNAPPSSYGGFYAYGTRRTVPTPQGDREMGAIGLPHFYFGELPHELGHADYLWNHATRYSCRVEGLGGVPYSIDPENCFLDSYGNPYDVRGEGLSTKPREKTFGHPGGFEKSLNGLVTVTTIAEESGEYPLAALEVPCSNVSQLLRIPYKDVPLCLEYRKPIGFDANFDLPPNGCLLLQICSNDPTTLGCDMLDAPRNGVTFLLQGDNCNCHPLGYPSTCIPPEGFHYSELGIDVRYRQSTTNPNAVIVNVSEVDETRLAKLPNLKAGDRIVKNVSETGESIGAFDIQIFGKRISDGEYELIETRTIDGLPLFGKVAINFTPDQLESLKLIYSELRVTADSGNVIEETDETDNQSAFGL